MKTIILGEKFQSKYDFRETCFGIVVKNEQLMVVKKNNQYSLVGGGIEKNETFEQCLKREFWEESGFQVTNIHPFICIDCFWLAAGKYPMESKANIFAVDIDFVNRKEPTEEGHTIEWVNINDAIELLPLPYHKEAIKSYLSTINKIL